MIVSSEYFKELARLSPKAHFQIIGYTHEQRLQVVLTITSPENYGKLEDIRKEHLKLLAAGSAGKYQRYAGGIYTWLQRSWQRTFEQRGRHAYGLVPGGSARREANNILRNAIIHYRSQLQSRRPRPSHHLG